MLVGLAPLSLAAMAGGDLIRQQFAIHGLTEDAWRLTCRPPAGLATRLPPDCLIALTSSERSISLGELLAEIHSLS